MSKFAEAWAEKVTTGSSGRKQILSHLAYRANHPHWICWPSNADLERVTEQKRSTVRANLKKLEEDGFIKRVERRRGNGTMQTAAIIVLGEPLNDIVRQIETAPSIPYVVDEILPDLKKLVIEQQPAPDFSAGQESPENCQKSSSAKIPQVVDSAQPAPDFDPLEPKLNNNSTPHSPPAGGILLADRVRTFTVTDEFAEDIAQAVDMPTQFVWDELERWRLVALDLVESGSRIKSLATNFRTWLEKHKGLARLKADWHKLQQNKSQRQLPQKPDTSPEAVFATPAGRKALDLEVGKQFLADCQVAEKILSSDYVTDLFEERQAKHAAPKDDIDARSQQVTKEAEYNFSKYWLERIEAVA